VETCKGIKMILSTQAYLTLKGLEGFKRNAYQDSKGIWTVGHGFTFINNKPVTQSTIINIPEADKLLKQLIEELELQLFPLILVPLNQNQWDALVLFVYNIGIGHFKTSEVLKLLNQKNFYKIPLEMLKWNKCDGVVVKGLENRRETESKLFRRPCNKMISV